jgi:hypothetical protein
MPGKIRRIGQRGASGRAVLATRSPRAQARSAPGAMINRRKINDRRSGPRQSAHPVPLFPASA